MSGNHTSFIVMFPIYGCRLTTFRPFGQHISYRIVGLDLLSVMLRCVVNNVKVTSYKVTSWIIYEWTTFSSAVRSFRFDWLNWFYGVDRHFQQYFSYILAVVQA